jgi:adenylate cyclase
VDDDFLKPATLDRAHDLARTAERLDPNLPQARARLGSVLSWKRQHDESIAEFERAIALNPNYVEWRYGFALVYAGNPRRAIDVLETYMRLDPFHTPLAQCILGAAHYMLEQYSQALPLLRDYVARSPKLLYNHTWLAATHAQLDQLEEAGAEASLILQMRPGYTIAGISRHVSAFKYPKDDKLFFDGLRKAGLPE